MKRKIALVTGGSRGLGKGMVMNLAKRGHKVIFTYHSNRAEADKVMNEVHSIGERAIAFPLDVSNIGSFDDFVADVWIWKSSTASLNTPNQDLRIEINKLSCRKSQ